MNSTLGLLPEPRRNPASIITSSICNLSILGLLLLFGATATHHIAPQKLEVTALYLPPSTPPPPPIKITSPPPAIVPVPTLPSIMQSPVMEPPKIQVQKPAAKPDMAPVNLPEAKTPLIQPTNEAPHIVLAPQPKAAINIAHAQSPSLQTHESVASIHFGSTTGQGSATRQMVASAGLGSFQAGRTGQPSGQVVAAGLPSRITSAMPSVARSQAEPTMTQIEVLAGQRPEYTDEARLLRIQGTVVLRVTVTSTGQVRVLSVVRGLGHGLDQSAAKAVEQYRVKPATRDGVPVEMTTNITITFQLA